MELLKKKAVVFCILLFSGLHSFSQTNEEMQNAFKSSYASEYKGDYQTAITAIQGAYKTDSYECNLRMGWLCYKAARYPASMDYYQKAIGLKQYSVEARLGYIKPAGDAKKYDKVYEMYEQILKIDPYNSIANYWIGVTCYTTKKYDIAAKYFELVVNMYPFDYDGNHMLGWTYLSLGRSAEAKLLFHKALLNRPGDTSAMDGYNKSK